MESIFKYLVIASIILSVIFWSLPFIEPYWVSNIELELLGADGYKSHLPYNMYMYFGMFSIWVLLYIGLLFFNKVARTGFLIFLVVTAIATFFWGYIVQTPISSGIGNLLSITDGAIVIVAYLTSVSNNFKKT